MDATFPNRKSLFLNLVLFAAGSFCGYLLNSHLDTVYIREQNSYHAAGAFEVSSLMRPLGKTQSHLVKYDPTICNKLKQIPCSECKAAKLSISAADQKRREASLKRYERRRINIFHGRNQVNGSSPISYPAHGVSVIPMRSVWLKGLQVEWFSLYNIRSNIKLKFQINATRGVFNLIGHVHDVDVTGNGSKTITISTYSPSLLNLQLKYIAYENTFFDANIVDRVIIQFMEFTATMPIHIQHVQLPWLFEDGTGQVKDRVTVVLKTFLRYSRLKNAIESVNRLYPGTRIVVADDTPDHLFTSFQSSNVDHYRMPAYKVGVGIQDRLSPTTYLALGNKTHRCIVQKPDPGYYSEIRGFPGIYTNDAVLNIFLASTNEAKAVGFDPHPLLARIGHNEFFLSALGRLRVAACSFCAVRHVRGGPVPGNYSKYRKPEKRFKAKRNNYNLYMHNIDCVKTQWVVNKARKQ
ncbi:PREDICTED: beta-1,4 N-acetylgalactosaminyltransferase 2-like isoform X2 [Branchiostoma belcheri]|uniref:Beta-1,4 N-acetylgalactosaminyltransferase 2-like isoform X2 n=1 Tax=Branchiostoma belcheri TaxID=7741 RepID=A0A6P4ZPA3_BRABE|nr:PREDICTED: beta-1,4 N-acetylgalactosaminyltransferase 2-like isoform X2 [Branchiostoma belcheri]